MTSIYPPKRLLASLVFVICVCAVSAMAQTTPPTPSSDTAAKLEPSKATVTTPATTKAVMTPVVHSVHDVELGMSIDDVKKKLGKPDVQDDTGLLFTLDGGDSVQIGLGPDKHVRTVAAIYGAGSKNAPAFKDIFGADAQDPAGDTYKMERYKDAGYWVSYSRSNSQ